MSGRELLAPSVPLRGRQVTRADFDQLKQTAVVLTLIFITRVLIYSMLGCISRCVSHFEIARKSLAIRFNQLSLFGRTVGSATS